MGDHTGEYVSMPDGSDAASALVAPTPELAAYTVQQGDTLSQIAERFNTTVQELVGLNPQLAQASGATAGQGLNPDVIFPGQQITLPPGTPGADVYAGGVGTNANTMADIAQGQVPNSAITQGMAARNAVRESIKYRARILPANKLIDQKATVLNWALSESVGRKSKSVNLTTLGTYTVFENIDRYRQAILEATQPGRPELPDQYAPAMPGGAGVPSKPGMIGRGLNWLDSKVKKVGGALSNFGHQFTTNVTKEKLKMNWHQAGKPSDSDQLATWLVGQGVPQSVVTSVFGKMGIPYTAPAAQATAQPAAPVGQTTAPAVGGAQRTSNSGSINPATGREYTGDEIRAKHGFTDPVPASDSTTDTVPGTIAPSAVSTPGATVPAGGKFPGEDPQGPGYVGRREAARRQAARAATVGKPARPNFSYQSPVYKSVTYAPNIKTGVSLPKPTAPATPTKTPTQVERDAYVRSIGAPAMAETRIATALKRPVAEMLQMVETKEDIQRIKQFVDDTFVRYGAVNESAFAMRNQILEHVTQIGAQRRREHSQRVAH
jgi:LysM repeat protein